MPCTPERVWRAIQEAEQSGAQAAQGAGTVAGDEPTTPDAQPHFEGSAPNQDTPDPGPSGGGPTGDTGSADQGGQR